ncbi:hypothetical protein [Zooshikella harenae]|uniref:Uncharacterized protein n=1 Tax=Zooshikella harenae TaxID=2827238 RepID=A0ABS5ZGX5_9GAMM|nr:hypothetical protein [Zooshikella harenae]MBU2713321.1 hypothetical protein [Zooshikella harenae]
MLRFRAAWLLLLAPVILNAQDLQLSEHISLPIPKGWEVGKQLSPASDLHYHTLYNPKTQQKLLILNGLIEEWQSQCKVDARIRACVKEQLQEKGLAERDKLLQSYQKKIISGPDVVNKQVNEQNELLRFSWTAQDNNIVDLNSATQETPLFYDCFVIGYIFNDQYVTHLTMIDIVDKPQDCKSREEFIDRVASSISNIETDSIK